MQDFVPMEQNSEEHKHYQELMAEVQGKMKPKECKKVFGQYYCEYDCDFLGMLDEYEVARKHFSKDHIIIDLGCYLAAQAYMFDNYAGYVGVDIVDMIRFTPDNAIHYVMGIEDFIEKELHKYEGKKIAAICSYVPTLLELNEKIWNTFKTCYMVYPSIGKRLKIDGKTIFDSWRE